jgi:hypothetical protein
MIAPSSSFAGNQQITAVSGADKKIAAAEAAADL